MFSPEAMPLGKKDALGENSDIMEQKLASELIRFYIPIKKLGDFLEVKNKIESAKTKTGLTVVTDVMKKTYEKGKAVAKNFMDHLKIKFGDSLPRLNYTISPMEISGM